VNGSGDLAVRFTMGWARTYTRRLAPEVRAARLGEIQSDLWEHHRDAEEASADPSDVALQILARCIVGMPSDLAWRSGAARRARADRRREPMNATIRRSWWLVPATLILLFDLWLFLGQLTEHMPFGTEGEPRVGVRLAASAFWLLFTVCMAAGIMLRNRRPQRAGWLVIVGTLPAFMLVWVVVPPLLAIATVVGAIGLMTTTPSPSQTPA
jgi:hypothetical protein